MPILQHGNRWDTQILSIICMISLVSLLMSLLMDKLTRQYPDFFFLANTPLTGWILQTYLLFTFLQLSPSILQTGFLVCHSIEIATWKLQTDLFWDKSNGPFIRLFFLDFSAPSDNNDHSLALDTSQLSLKDMLPNTMPDPQKTPHLFFCTSLILSCFQEDTKEGYVLKDRFTLRQIPSFCEPAQDTSSLWKLSTGFAVSSNWVSLYFIT